MEEGDCTLVCYLQPSGFSTAGFFLVHLVLGRDFIRVEAAWLDCCMIQFYIFALFRPISKKQSNSLYLKKERLLTAWDSRTYLF